jgi:exodeoxyribonuclease-5
MDIQKVNAALRKQFAFDPTPGQDLLISAISNFMLSTASHDTFLIKGYAGTGKTSIVSALVKTLPEFKLKSVLLAPTGRAAKVLSNYSGKPAYTIHKKIYKQKATGGSALQFVRQMNLHTNTLFIVDEASMINNQSDEIKSSTQKNLLDDLMDYVFEGSQCKLILIGDTAQLPPVGSDASPALDEEYLKAAFDLSLTVIELTEVVRQKKRSGILENATGLRERIRTETAGIPQFGTKGFSDIYRMTGERLEDGLNYAYNKYGVEDSIIICRSNKQANLYNQQIRARIRWMEEDVATGDYMMVVRNNYFWLPEESQSGFIANGDIIEILKVKGYMELYGFRFAKVLFRLIDFPNEQPIESIIILDTIMSESPALSYADNKKLFEAVMEDYADIPQKYKKIQEVKKSPYFNALQVKFAYAVTCHKAQGGQWKAVFVDQGYLTEENVNTEFLRWLYTAITRASDELFLVNFNDKFFGEP